MCSHRGTNYFQDIKHLKTQPQFPAILEPHTEPGAQGCQYSYTELKGQCTLLSQAGFSGRLLPAQHVCILLCTFDMSILNICIAELQIYVNSRSFWRKQQLFEHRRHAARWKGKKRIWWFCYFNILHLIPASCSSTSKAITDPCKSNIFVLQSISISKQQI